MKYEGRARILHPGPLDVTAYTVGTTVRVDIPTVSAAKAEELLRALVAQWLAAEAAGDATR